MGNYTDRPAGSIGPFATAPASGGRKPPKARERGRLNGQHRCHRVEASARTVASGGLRPPLAGAAGAARGRDCDGCAGRAGDRAGPVSRDRADSPTAGPRQSSNIYSREFGPPYRSPSRPARTPPPPGRSLSHNGRHRADRQKFTAVQIVLLAADDLTKAGNLEFSEWDLTVAAWSRDRFRFGLRGYAQRYPDHKRVMMEIMGQKPNSPVFRKLFEKVRPNYYRLTPLGKTAAARLADGPRPSRRASR